MASESGDYDVSLETAILTIVQKIKKQRNRAHMENIHQNLVRGRFSFGLDDLRVFLDGLLERKMLINLSKDRAEPGKESFTLSDMACSIGEEDKDGNEEEYLQDLLCTQNMENLINESFVALVNEKIAQAVESVVGEKLKEFSANIVKPPEIPTSLKCNKPEEIVTSAECSIKCALNYELIDALNKQIDFLQKELENKNTIIMTILNERNDHVNNNSSCNTNDVIKKSTTSTNPFLNYETIDQDKEHHLIIEDKHDDEIPPTFNAIKYDYANTQRSNHDTFNMELNRHDKHNLNADNTHNKLPTIKKKPAMYQAQTKKKPSTRSVSIVGDSLLRDIKAYDLKKLLPRETRVYVGPHSGATVEDMIDYVNPSRKRNPDLLIIHAGTNDLRSGKQPVQIASEIIELALSLKTDRNEVAVSAIVQRNDAFNEKGKLVNNFLRTFTTDLNFGFIEHGNVQNIHLNNSGLHLNDQGITIVSNNFANFIKI